MPTSVQVNQIIVEVLAEPDNPTVRANQVFVEALVPLFGAPVQVNQVWVEALLPAIYPNRPPTAPGSFISPTTGEYQDSVDLEWGAATDPDSDPLTYRGERQVNSGTWDALFTYQSELTYNDNTSALNSNDTVRYRTYAYDGEYESDPTYSDIITIERRPAVPVLTLTADSQTQITVEIDTGVRTDTVAIYRSDVEPVELDVDHLIWNGAVPAPDYLDTGRSSGTEYFYRAVATGTGGTRESDTVSVETLGFGTPPDLRVGNITSTTAQLVVTNRYGIPGILEVRYQTALQSVTDWATLIDEYYDTEPDSYTHDLTGLVVNTDYKSRAKYRYIDGWSSWSSILTYRTEPVIPPGTLGYTGLWSPRFGEIVRGTAVSVQLIDKVLDSQGHEVASSDDTSWNLYISPELEGDDNWQLVKNFSGWTTTFDSTQYADSIEYRLKAVGNEGTVRMLNALKIDNANSPNMKWCGFRKFDTEDVSKWTEIWNQGNRHWGGPWGPPNDWYSGWGVYGSAYSAYGGQRSGFVFTEMVGRFWDCTVEGRIGGGEGGQLWQRCWDQELSSFGLFVAAKGNDDPTTFKGYFGSLGSFLGFPYACGIYPCTIENWMGCLIGNKMHAALASSELDPSRGPLGEFEINAGTLVGVARYCVEHYGRDYRYRLRVRLEQDTETPADCWLRIHAEGPQLSFDTQDYWQFNIRLEDRTPECGWAGFYRWHIANEPGGTEDAGWAAYDSYGATLLPDTNETCDYIEPPPTPLCESLLKTPTVRVAVDCATLEVKVTASDYLTRAETWLDPDAPEQGYEGYVPNNITNTKWTLWEKGNDTPLVEDLLQGKVPTYTFTGYDPGVYEVEVCFYDKCGTQCNKVQFCIPCPCENAALKDFSELRLGPLISLEDHKKALIDFETKFNQLVKALRGS